MKYSFLRLMFVIIFLTIAICINICYTLDKITIVHGLFNKLLYSDPFH